MPLATLPGPTILSSLHRRVRWTREVLTELLDDGLELLDVGVVLGLLLDLHADSLDRSDSGREVVESSGSSDHGLDDLDGRDEIVGEAVVHSSLQRGQERRGHNRWSATRSTRVHVQVSVAIRLKVKLEALQRKPDRGRAVQRARRGCYLAPSGSCSLLPPC